MKSTDKKYFSQLKIEDQLDELFSYKKNGTFLDVGCCSPFYVSNTAGMEVNHGWRGIGVDISPHDNTLWGRKNSEHDERWELRPNTKIYEASALEFDFQKAFDECDMPDVIDFVNVDIDTVENNIQVVRKLLQTDRKFNIILMETDHYSYDRSSIDPYLEKVDSEFSKSGYIHRANTFFEDYRLHEHYRIQDAIYIRADSDILK